jgi:hypothetical protein
MDAKDRLMRPWMLLLVTAAIAATACGAEKTGDRSANAKTPPDINLTGTWRGYVVRGKGEQPDRGTVQLELSINGYQILAKRLDGQGGPLGKGSYRITADRSYQLDATETGSRGHGKVYLGIAKFGPDLMYWCVSNPGNKRPEAFETKGQQFLLILKRQRQ